MTFQRLLFSGGVRVRIGDNSATFLYLIGRFKGLGGGYFTANTSRVLDEG